MFDESTDLSPDSEWLLLSGQVDEETIIEFLARKYYQQIYQLALSRLTYPEEAHRAAQETFLQAALEAKKYRGGTSIDDWLISIATGICQIRALHLKDHQFLNPKIINSMLSHQSLEILNSLQIEHSIKKIKSQIQQRHAVDTKRSVYQISGVIGIVILAVYLMVIFSSSWIYGSQIEYSPASFPISTDEVEIQIDEIPLSFREPLNTSNPFVPLSLNSDQDEILNRIQQSSLYWDTLWAEVVVTFYGSSGYIGPPYSERHQVWIDGNHGGLLVSGSLQGYPDFIQNHLNSDEVIIPKRELGSQVLWFSIKLDTLSRFPFAVNNYYNPTYQKSPQDFTYSPIGEFTLLAQLEFCLLADRN